MSRHEGVSCDACSKGSFSGNRYKCLVCYDFDLCSTCYDAGATSAQHVAQHPMQCIIAKNDFDLYYGGEELNRELYPQSFSCPLCGCMGFTDSSLHDHVVSEHSDEAVEVVCPICAAAPGGDPNHVTDNFMAHMMLEHRTEQTIMKFIWVPLSNLVVCPKQSCEVWVGDDGGKMYNIIRHLPRSPCAPRDTTKRTSIHYQAEVDIMARHQLRNRVWSDGIGSKWDQRICRKMSKDALTCAELLSQLTNARNRAAAVQNISSQLQMLEMQLQSTRQQLEGLPARHSQASKQPTLVVMTNPSTSGSSNAANESDNSKQFLLSRLEDAEFSESEIETIDVDRADRGVFVQELLLATDVGGITLDDVTDITAPQTSHSDCNVDKREIIAPSPSSMAKLPKAECDAKPVTIPEVQRECAPRKFTSVNHPHPEKNETRVQKTRLLPPPKVLKYRGSKESAPPPRK